MEQTHEVRQTREFPRNGSEKNYTERKGKFKQVCLHFLERAENEAARSREREKEQRKEE